MEPPFSQQEHRPAISAGLPAARGFVSPELVRIFAHSLSDAELVIETVRQGRTVVLNACGMRGRDGRRLLDFTLGGILAMDGQMHRIGQGVYLLAPALARILRI